MGDRAIAIRLRAGRPAVLFVPTVCGAMGNCRWRLYDSRSGQFLGELSGQFIYARTATGGWPSIVVHFRNGYCNAVLVRHEMQAGRYVATGEAEIGETTPGVECDLLRGTLARARRLCSTYGS